MKTNGEPLYVQISRILKEDIEVRHPVGGRLESEGQLAARFGVNRHTLRRAVDELVRQGLVARRRGVGLFVAGKPLQYALHTQTRITTGLQEMGVHGERHFLKRTVRPAGLEVGRQLGVRKDRLVLVLESIVLADGIPLCLSTHTFVHNRYRRIFEEFGEGSLHAFVQSAYGLKLRRRESCICSQIPCDADAGLLRLSLNEPVLCVSSLNCDNKSGEPVEYVVSRFRADRIEFTIRY